MQYWLFGADPKRYDLVEEVPQRLGKGDSWKATIHRNDLAVGDKVILWQSGPKGGVYAFGKLMSKAHNSRSEWFDIRYTRLLKQPVFKRDLRMHPLLRKLGVLKMPRGKNPFPVKENEWHALQELIRKDTVNIFTSYQQEENQFTNGLVALLELSSKCDGPLSITSFLDLLPSLRPKGRIGGFHVLRGFDGTADAELCGVDCCIRFETKIRSGTLRDDQVRDHLKRLERSREALKALVLLTPDDGKSNYITQFRSKDKHRRILHLEWRRVYDYLEHSVSHGHALVFSRLVHQFLDKIRDRIFEQDFAGIIQKINFVKGGIDHRTFLQDIKAWDEGDWWDTPDKYEKLDGTGRKLLLYDSQCEEKGIVAEVEIESVEHKRGGGRFPWRNVFANKPEVFARPIPLERIRLIPGFEEFGQSGGKDRTPYRNITREQYRLLTAPIDRGVRKV